MTEIVFAVEEMKAGGFTAKCKSASIHTHADTLDELKTHIIEAIHCHFDEHAIQTIRLHIYREETIAL